MSNHKDYEKKSGVMIMLEKLTEDYSLEIDNCFYIRCDNLIEAKKVFEEIKKICSKYPLIR